MPLLDAGLLKYIGDLWFDLVLQFTSVEDEEAESDE